MLKSLVVYDDKGGVGGLSLPGREPLRQAFKDLPFDQAARSTRRPRCWRRSRARRSRSAAARAISGRIVSVEEETVDLARRQGHDQAHARHAADRHAACSSSSSRTPRTCNSPTPRCATRSARRCCAIQANRAKDARTLELVDARPGPAHRARRLHRRGAGVEGLLPPDPAGRSGGAALGAAGLGHGRESERPGLEGRRADAGLGPPRRLPPGALRRLLRDAAGSAGRGRGPADARHRSRRRRRPTPKAAPPPPPPAPAPAPLSAQQQRARHGRDGAAAASGAGGAPIRSRPPTRRRRSSSSSRAR